MIREFELIEVDGRPMWRHESGRVLPVVAGGATEGEIWASQDPPDSGAADSGGGADSGAAAPPAESTPPASSGGPPEDVLAAELPDTVDRGWAEKLRREGQRYREQAREYDEVFGAYPDEDKQVIFDMFRTWASGPEGVQRAATQMQQIATAVLEEGGTPEQAAEAAGAVAEAQQQAEDAGGTLTADQVEEIVAEALAGRDEETERVKQVEGIYAELAAAGYDVHSDDEHKLTEAQMVLNIAAYNPELSIADAVAKMDAYKQSVIDGFVAGKRNGNAPSTTPAQGAEATGDGADEFDPKNPWGDIKGDIAKWRRSRDGAQAGG